MQASKWLDTRYKTLEQFVVLGLVLIAIILSGVYLNMDGVIPSRAQIMIIPIGVKSIIIIAYELLTEHTAKFARWRSFKANAILNCLEVVFWLAVIVLKFMSISSMCSGSSCAVNWFIALFAMAVLFLLIHLAALSIVEYKAFRKHAGHGASRV